MEEIIIFGSFILFLIIGIPVALSLGMASLIYALLSGFPAVVICQRFFTGVDNYLLLAIGFFFLAGKLMNEGNITTKLVRLSRVLVGRVRGSLAIVNVVTSIFFAGITGSASADTSAVGGILIPAMEKEGYDKEFSAAVTVASSTIGPIIPPSITFVVYASIANVSVGGLFLAGILPGLMIGFSQMGLCYYYAIKRNYPVETKNYSTKEILSVIFESIPSLLTIVIVLGGIIFGIFTPTEASAIAAIYSLFLTLFIYRTINLKTLSKIFADVAVFMASILLIVAAAAPFAWILAAEQVPQTLTHLICTITDNSFFILLFLIFIIIFTGTFLETLAALIILTPILLPLGNLIGLNPIQFGVIITLCIGTAVITPPVGICLYIASGIAKVDPIRIGIAVLPFLIITILVTLFLSIWPDLLMLIPKLCGF